MTKLKYTTLLDYVLAILQITKDSEPNKYISLVSVVNALGYKASFSETQEIGKYLDTRGWAKVVFLLGDVRAQITSKGLVYLEEKPNEFDNSLQTYLEELLKKTGKTKEELMIAALGENEEPKKNIQEILDSLIKKIESKEGKNLDVSKDLEVIKIEISKSFPDFQLIEIKLNRLSNLDYISSEVQELKDYLLVPAN